jgi:hypothetical protein
MQISQDNEVQQGNGGKVFRAIQLTTGRVTPPTKLYDNAKTGKTVSNRNNVHKSEY